MCIRDSTHTHIHTHTHTYTHTHTHLILNWYDQHITYNRCWLPPKIRRKWWGLDLREPIEGVALLEGGVRQFSQRGQFRVRTPGHHAQELLFLLPLQLFASPCTSHRHSVYIFCFYSLWAFSCVAGFIISVRTNCTPCIKTESVCVCVVCEREMCV